MAFLDNSGDIILDAVLTDTGRFRLAKGDGSFKIVKFALGDDEVDYTLYNKSHSSGSAYYDLEILQTPILEAFTNNTSTMKSRLVSIPRTNLLYLPVLKLSGNTTLTYTSSSLNLTDAGDHFGGTFVVAVDQNTSGQMNSGITGLLEQGGAATSTAIPNYSLGVLDGFDPFAGGGFADSQYIRVDEGLDTTEISSGYQIDADLNETQYIIEIDNRFGTIVTPPGVSLNRAANVSFIDDDNIASYYLSLNTDRDVFVYDLVANDATTTISGPLGTSLKFRIQASTDLQTSTFLFDQLGSTGLNMMSQPTTTDSDGVSLQMRFIDTTIKITGATTGASISIPVRFVKRI